MGRGVQEQLLAGYTFCAIVKVQLSALSNDVVPLSVLGTRSLKARQGAAAAVTEVAKPFISYKSLLFEFDVLAFIS